MLVQQSNSKLSIGFTLLAWQVYFGWFEGFLIIFKECINSFGASIHMGVGKKGGVR